jgi:hypothetical protein
MAPLTSSNRPGLEGPTYLIHDMDTKIEGSSIWFLGTLARGNQHCCSPRWTSSRRAATEVKINGSLAYVSQKTVMCEHFRTSTSPSQWQRVPRLFPWVSLPFGRCEDPPRRPEDHDWRKWNQPFQVAKNDRSSGKSLLLLTVKNIMWTILLICWKHYLLNFKIIYQIYNFNSYNKLINVENCGTPKRKGITHLCVKMQKA